MGDERPWSRFKAEIYSVIGRNPRSNKRLVEFADLTSSSKVLDIGCGPGAAVRRAARIATAGSATGVDPSSGMVAIARRRSQSLPNVSFELGSAEALPLQADTFTHVWSIHAFHHWSDERSGLAECLRVLQPHGQVLIVETRGRGGHSMSEARADEVADTLRDVGFAGTSIQRVHREIVVSGTKAG